MKKKRPLVNSVPGLVLSIVMFMLMQIIIVVSGVRFGGRTFNLLGMEIGISSINGIMSMLLIGSVFLIIKNGRTVGTIIGIVALAISTTSVVAKILATHDASALPGVCINVVGALIALLYANQLKLVEKKEDHLEMMVITDVLTGLANKQGIIEELHQYVKAKKPFYLLLMDLDNFKVVNDSMGHTVGDKILIEVCNRLSKINNSGGVLGRSGGDEFLMIVPDTKGTDIESILNSCLEMIGRQIDIEEQDYSYSPGVSIGVSHFPDNCDTPDDLLKYADSAMYAAKQNGRNQYFIFNNEMKENMTNELKMEELVREALINDWFYLVFQPQYNTSDKELYGFETLIRCRDNQGQNIGPASFIPVAEKSSLILDIDHWVIKHAIYEFARMLKGKEKKSMLSINISSKHLFEPDFVDTIKYYIEESGCPADCIEIEITEYCVMMSLDNASGVLNQLKDMGVHIALDDFGTGYASLSYLNKLPIDLLKIDKSFIDQMGVGNGEEFVSAIISMGHLCSCKVIAEGVETTDQLGVLDRLGCDYIQGYVWGKPMEADKAEALMS